MILMMIFWMMIFDDDYGSAEVRWANDGHGRTRKDTEGHGMNLVKLAKIGQNMVEYENFA